MIGSAAENRSGQRKLGRDTLAGTLSAKFVEEVVLLQRGPLAQQFEQRIFQSRSPRSESSAPCSARCVELAEVRGQSARRNTQFQHGFRAAAQKANQISHLGSLLRRAGREFQSHAVSRMRDPHHAFGVDRHISAFQAKVDQRPSPETANRFPDSNRPGSDR